MPAAPEVEIEIAEIREYSIWPGGAQYLLIRKVGSDEWYDIKARGPNRAKPMAKPIVLTAGEMAEAISLQDAVGSGDRDGGGGVGIDAIFWPKRR